MKAFFAILLVLTTLFAFQKEKGKIDMHGGKSQNYGGLSKKLQDKKASDSNTTK
ncbi:hypothetical protein [Campylobacter sp.]|uniref:hypothetical protein n=1 Tax=Campylobacter sp. TaxID=205 RepID=UPI00270F02E3|nr:hypothetical protein [Campylobacter sp.]